MGKVLDVCKRVSKTAVSYIPGAGPVLSELIDYGVSQFENKKLEEFMKDVENRLSKIEEKVDFLKSDEFGYFYFIKATKRWMEESEKDKKELFAECVKNGYISNISEAKKLIFLNKLSEYPVQLLRVLNYFNENHFKEESKNVIIHGTISVERAVCEHLTEFVGNEEMLRYFINLLQADQMIFMFGAYDQLTKDRAYKKWTTQLGEEFVKFVGRLKF